MGIVAHSSIHSVLSILQQQKNYIGAKMSDGNYSQYNIDGSNVNEETVSHLRQRLNVMREICKDDDKNGKTKKRRRGKSIDTIIDGSMMGAVLAVCLQWFLCQLLCIQESLLCSHE